MSFKETPRFPDGLSAGSKYGPAYSTGKAYNLGGFRAANRNWSMPLYEGDVGYAVKDQDDLDDLLAFFHGMAGGYDGFRFKNWNDYTATGSEGTVVQLTSTTWQMYKTYTYGALTPTRKIVKPVSGIVVSGGGTYSVDTTTGIITAIGSPLVDATGWTGEFDDPVEFTTDKMLPSWISFELYEWTSIPIRELRL